MSVENIFKGRKERKEVKEDGGLGQTVMAAKIQRQSYFPVGDKYTKTVALQPTLVPYKYSIKYYSLDVAFPLNEARFVLFDIL